MIRVNRRPTYKRWDEQTGRRHMVLIYLIGTIGVGIIIALGIVLATKAGWVQGVQTTLRRIELPGLPSAPQTGLHDAFQGLGNKVGQVEQSTTTLWQRGSEGPRQLNRSSQPSGAGRRD